MKVGTHLGCLISFLGRTLGQGLKISNIQSQRLHFSSARTCNSSFTFISINHFLALYVHVRPSVPHLPSTTQRLPPATRTG